MNVVSVQKNFIVTEVNATESIAEVHVFYLNEIQGVVVNMRIILNFILDLGVKCLKLASWMIGGKLAILIKQ